MHDTLRHVAVVFPPLSRSFYLTVATIAIYVLHSPGTVEQLKCNFCGMNEEIKIPSNYI